VIPTVHMTLRFASTESARFAFDVLPAYAMNARETSCAHQPIPHHIMAAAACFRVMLKTFPQNHRGIAGLVSGLCGNLGRDVPRSLLRFATAQSYQGAPYYLQSCYHETAEKQTVQLTALCLRAVQSPELLDPSFAFRQWFVKYPISEVSIRTVGLYS
jgi:hypothetical protein